MLFIRLFAVLSSFSCINFANGMWISKFFGDQHLKKLVLSTKQDNSQDKFNEIAPLPFPPFLNFFLQRSVIPFRYVSREDGEAKDKLTHGFSNINHGEKPFLFEDSKDNDSFHKRTDTSTGKLANKITPTRLSRYIQKLVDPTTKTPIFRRLHEPFRNRFYYFQTMLYKQHKPYNNQEKLDTNQNATLEKFNGSQIEVTSLTGQAKKKLNCTEVIYSSRYYYLWRYNSFAYIMALSVALVALIAVFLAIGAFFCELYSSNKQQEAWISKRKQEDFLKAKYVHI